MNPSDKKEEEKEEADSTAENKPESASSDQETERPSSQSGEATSSSKPSSKPPSLAMLQKIAASFGEGKVPEFIKKQIQSLSNTQKSKPGLPPLSPKKPNPNPKPKPRPDPNPNPDPSPDDPDPDDPILFDIFVTNSERLPIAYDPAVYHFPASSSSSALSEQILQFTDPTGQLWADIAYVCFNSEEAFILTRNWAQYARVFNLGIMDTVRFVRPNPRLGPNHFELQHLPRPDSQPVIIRFPEFLPQNFLFQVELEKGDVAFGRLVIGADQVRLHFPGVREDQKQEMVKLTDFRDKDWYVTMVYSGFGDRYMVMDGWEGIVREHELGDGDFVRFYKPDLLAHDKHFLIQFERQARAKA